jgi:hypothetical protein
VISSRRILSFCGVALLCCLPACGGSGEKAKDPKGDLIQLVQAYRSYRDPDRKEAGPPNSDAWVKWAQKDEMVRHFVPLIEQCKPGGKYVFYWGVTIPAVDAPEIVLGYERDVPDKGGMVAFINGNIKPLTVAEFAAAAKPAGK